MRQVYIAFDNYKVTKNGNCPENLDELLVPYLDGDKNVFVNPVTGDYPGYEYVKPEPDASPNTVILYQLRDGERDVELEVLYYDGSVRELE